MKKICLKITLMICALTLLLLPVTRMLRSAYQKSLEEPVFRFPKETTILVAGDSHMETAVDPAFCPHAENVSCSGENYFYTYYKLRQLLAKNPQISEVVLGFSWHNFPEKYQQSFLFGAIPSKIDQYFLLLDHEGREIISTTQSAYLVPWLRYCLGVPLQLYSDQIAYQELFGGRPGRGSFGFFGGYLAIRRSNLDQERITQKVQRYYYDRGTPASASRIMTSYLMKILELCRDHHISVVLLNTPVHPRYRRLVPAPAVASFERIKTELLRKFPNVSYLDCSALPLPSGDFSDGDHVNAKGAEIVTAALREDHERFKLMR